MLRHAFAGLSALLFVALTPHLAAESPAANASATSGTNSSSPLQPFSAVYQAEFSGFGVTAERKLSGSPESWRLDFSAHSMFAKIDEYSRFSQQSNRLVPQHYDYKKSGLGRDRHTALSFEHDQRRIINVYKKDRTIDNAPRNVQDKISYQLQLALDVAAGKEELKYVVADGKKLRRYEFMIAGKENIQTPMGLIETIKVQRVRAEDAERVTNIWLAPEWNYALVKLMQQEDNGKSYQITLTKLSINGKPVDEKK